MLTLTDLMCCAYSLRVGDEAPESTRSHRFVVHGDADASGSSSHFKTNDWLEFCERLSSGTVQPGETSSSRTIEIDNGTYNIDMFRLPAERGLPSELSSKYRATKPSEVKYGWEEDGKTFEAPIPFA